MSEVKWIKLMTDVFDNRKIRQIEAMPEGDQLVIVWFKLLCLAGKVNDRGAIYFTAKMPYTKEMLANEFNRQPAIIELALRTFEAFEMLEISDDATIYITGWEEHQNVDGMEKVREQARLRKQKQRAKLKAVNDSHVTGHGTVTQCHAIEEDIDIDIDKDKEEEEKEEEENPINPSAATIKSLIDFWNNNFHPIVMHEAEQLADLEKDCGAANVLEAMKRAVEANKRAFNYVRAVAYGLANDDDFRAKKSAAVDGDYWATMFKEAKDDN